jgi:hypothetical protein
MLRRSIVLLTLLLLLGACGDDDGTAAPSTTTEPYPPSAIDELAEIFDPQLEPLGLRITRGGLFDRRDGRYDPSDEGNHPALYAEPLDDADYDDADYVEGLGTVTALVTPQVFDRWPGVDTYDICQEPPAAVDDSEAPAPYTQIEIGREAADAVDWDTATAATVIALGESGEARVVVTPSVSQDPAYLEAQAAG